MENDEDWKPTIHPMIPNVPHTNPTQLESQDQPITSESYGNLSPCNYIYIFNSHLRTPFFHMSVIQIYMSYILIGPPCLFFGFWKAWLQPPRTDVCGLWGLKITSNSYSLEPMDTVVIESLMQWRFFRDRNPSTTSKKMSFLSISRGV